VRGVEGGVPFPQVLHEEVWEEEQSRPAAAAQHTTERRERARGRGEGREAAGAAAEARSIRSGSGNQVASVDRASHLSIHLSSSTGINPHASVGGRGGGGDGQRPPPSVGEGGQAVRWGDFLGAECPGGGPDWGASGRDL
jgi:hypothetical protein